MGSRNRIATVGLIATSIVMVCGVTFAQDEQLHSVRATILFEEDQAAEVVDAADVCPDIYEFVSLQLTTEASSEGHKLLMARAPEEIPVNEYILDILSRSMEGEESVCHPGCAMVEQTAECARSYC